jgi:23S rRNA (cytidine1920-2'-O)/16S rRNA (cytidine1409-2'-O)-methyltransferase
MKSGQTDSESYVSRGGLKLDSVAKKLALDFKDKTVIDVGSSTGGFSDYALKHGATKLYAIELGTNQLHPSLRLDDRVELHEKTNILDFAKPEDKIDIVMIDVSFDQLAKLLPACARLIGSPGQILALFKPQFEAQPGQLNRGVVKNNSMRRQIIKDFESWLKQNDFLIIGKADSLVRGCKGNQERFYSLAKARRLG